MISNFSVARKKYKSCCCGNFSCMLHNNNKNNSHSVTQLPPRITMRNEWEEGAEWINEWISEWMKNTKKKFPNTQRRLRPCKNWVKRAFIVSNSRHSNASTSSNTKKLPKFSAAIFTLLTMMADTFSGLL